MNIRIPSINLFKVRLWLSVYEGLCPMGPYELWTRSIVTPFAPRESDTIHLWYGEEDKIDSVSWTVRKHYWSWNGFYNCDLTHMVIDPQNTNPTGNYLYSRSWHTDVDDRPESNLRRAGWMTYKEYHETLEREK